MMGIHRARRLPELQGRHADETWLEDFQARLLFVQNEETLRLHARALQSDAKNPSTRGA